MQNILLVIDMQNDFISGVLGTPEALEILPRVEKRIRDFNGRIIFTRDTHDQNYMDTQEGKNLPVPHCIKGTDGWQIHMKLQKYCKEEPVDKITFGASGLVKLLQKADREEKIECITLIGLCTDICVISNAILLKAFFPEVKLVVDASCCAGVTPESHQTALEAMRACQIQIDTEKE